MSLTSRCTPSSVSSAKGGVAWPGGAQTCSPSSTYRYRSLAQPPAATTRLSSISSHYSSFISQGTAYSKPPSPMPSDITGQVRGRSELPTPVPQFPFSAECNTRGQCRGDVTPDVFPAALSLQEINIGNIRDACLAQGCNRPHCRETPSVTHPPPPRDGAQVFPPCQGNRVFPNHPSPIIPVCTSPPPGSMDQSFPPSCILSSAKDAPGPHSASRKLPMCWLCNQAAWHCQHRLPMLTWHLQPGKSQELLGIPK